jgi:amino acid transporter
MLYLSATVALALIAKTFGSYALALLPGAPPEFLKGVLAAGIVVFFVLVNLAGAKDVALLERLLVGFKFLVLVVLAVVGIACLKPSMVAPSTYPPALAVFNSLAVTFFAFEGFRVITNAAEDMEDPARTLPRAMFTAVLLVLGLYVAVSFAVFGSLPVERVIATKDYALAEAAKPAFGTAGFTIVAVTALVSTASSINANLYAVTNVTYQMAKDGELPSRFGRPVAHSREGLVISGLLVIVLALLLDLTQIAVLGSISILMVHALVHLGHLRKRGETGAHAAILVGALVATLTAIGLAVVFECRHSPGIIVLLVAFLAVSGGLEWLLQRVAGRKITARTPRTDR